MLGPFPRALSLLLALLLRPRAQAAPFEQGTEEVSGGGCPYFHKTACAAEPFKSFLQEWQKKTQCWLCNNQELVLRSRSVVKELLYSERPELPLIGQEINLHPIWKETCVAGSLLALFATTRSQSVQPWSFYEIGLSLITGCAFEEATFFKLYGVTPSQVAYNFYILGLPYHRPNPVLHIQEAELGRHAEELRDPQDAPLVIDVGMGLGADTRYFLSQGFRVVAVEANRRAIEVATAVDWVKPLVLEGQLVFLHAAVAAPGEGGSSTTVYAFDQRPEQSNAQAWVEEVGGVAKSVRTIECADLLRLFGQAVYMKIDVESSTVDCLDSLVQSHRDGGRRPVLPKFLSMELEAASLFERFYANLKELGYLFYKACRQYIYSPAPCEQGQYSSEVPGCGSGPFGVSAVDYLRGLRWNHIDALPFDRQWVEEFEKGLDWFDLHAMRAA